jgi:tetratricopeptide (TPR) repeat protein
LGPVTEGAKGDAYLELGQNDKALSQYKKAYQLTDNELTTPVYMMKAANLLESMDELEDALTIYKNIKEKYPKSTEGTQADRYIARVEIKLS